MWLFSCTHIFENIVPRYDSFQFSRPRIGNRQTPQMHMFEDVEHFLQLVCALCQKGLLNNVGTHIHHLLLIFLANISNFSIFAIQRVKVLIEEVPGELLHSLGHLSSVAQASESFQDLLTLLDILRHLFRLKFLTLLPSWLFQIHRRPI